MVAAAVLSLAYYLRLPGTLPSEADYRAAAADIASQARDGDAVLLSPHWAERARLFVTGVPVLNLGRAPAREDLYRFRRIFLLALPELPRSSPGAEEAFLRSIDFKPAGPAQPHGRLSVRLFENPAPAIPRFDFTAGVADAHVFIRRPDGSEELCPRREDRHPCPRAGWIDVHAELKEIAAKPQRCVWAHPAGSEPLVIEYPDVELGDELRVMGGIVGQIVYRTENYGTVLMEVKVDGQRLGSMDFPPGKPGEKRARFDTRALKGARHTVSFEVSAANPDMRHFCFDAGAF